MHKILPVSNERWAGRSKIKNAANRRKTACSGAFGVPDTTRTCDPGLRRLVLYPTELLGHISKIFNFPAQTDSNKLPLRRRMLYPAELQRHFLLPPCQGMRSYYNGFPAKMQAVVTQSACAAKTKNGMYACRRLFSRDKSLPDIFSRRVSAPCAGPSFLPDA